MSEISKLKDPSSDKGYQIFLLTKLAISRNIIEKNLKPHLIWDKGKELLEEFYDSGFDTVDKGLYECIENFFNTLIRVKINILALANWKYDYDYIEDNIEDFSVEYSEIKVNGCKPLIIENSEQLFQFVGYVPSTFISNKKELGLDEFEYFEIGRAHV